MMRFSFPFLLLITAIVFNNFTLRPIHAGQLPAIKQIYEEHGVQKEVDVSLPSGNKAEIIKIGNKGRVYAIDKDDNTESLIADIEVISITPDGLAHAKRTKGSNSIKIKAGDIVKFLLPPLSVVNHLMAGVTKEEFYNAYKECATPPQKYTFLDTDRCATQWFSYQNATPGDTITWKWYAPGEHLYYEDKGTVDTVEGCWRSYLDISGHYALHNQGQWQVKVYRNGQFLFSDTFTISKHKPAEVPVQPEKKASPVPPLVNSVDTEEVAAKRPDETVSPPEMAVVPPSGEKITNSIGMTFVYLKPDTFMMGSPENEAYREKDEMQHPVTLTKGFYLQTTEVAQGQWKKVMDGKNPSHFQNGGDDCPVETVSWDNVQGFIERLNKAEGGGKYRLPTEAEWEYAARSGGKEEKYAGTSDESRVGEYAWYGKNSDDKTHKVGTRNPNGLGIYDMSGNVWEWCSDWYGADYYQNSPKDNPMGPASGSYRVDRGGSWGRTAEDLRASNRDCHTPAFRNFLLGFRLARTP